MIKQIVYRQVITNIEFNQNECFVVFTYPLLKKILIYILKDVKGVCRINSLPMTSNLIFRI